MTVDNEASIVPGIFGAEKDLVEASLRMYPALISKRKDPGLEYGYRLRDAPQVGAHGGWTRPCTHASPVLCQADLPHPQLLVVLAHHAAAAEDRAAAVAAVVARVVQAVLGLHRLAQLVGGARAEGGSKVRTFASAISAPYPFSTLIPMRAHAA